MRARLHICLLWLTVAFFFTLLEVANLPVPSQDAEAQSAALVCGQTLMADTVLANDLMSCSGDGLVMGTSDIRLDCDSHRILGAGTGIGIRIPSGISGVAIVNCEVRHFDTGLSIGDTGEHDILHNTITNNRVGILTGSGQRPSVVANNVFHNAINAQVQGNASNPWDRQEGRFVAFQTSDKTLVSSDTNGEADIFVHDRLTGFTERVSVASDGAQANGSSDAPALSANGREVVFQSQASNLVDGDTNGEQDIFLHDRHSGMTTQLSLGSDGLSADGSSVAPAVSADGRIVAFQSTATNLIADDTNGVADIFVYDLRSGVTTRVSLATDGTEGNGRSLAPALSSDGAVVAFQSLATNFAAGVSNGMRHIFVHDRRSGITTPVNLAADGTEADKQSFNAVLSATGDHVAFQSNATNLVADDINGKADIFVHDRVAGRTTRVSLASDGTEANGNSFDPVLSAAGRFVAFRSVATNLVANDTNAKADIFVHDRQNGLTLRVSVASDGSQADGNNQSPLVISADGRLVAFQSFARNLVPGDTNGVRDTFVHDRLRGTTVRVGFSTDGAETQKSSFGLAMSVSTREMNIVEGPFLGGNFYSKPDGTGFSQRCTDGDGDGFCDTAFAISEGNVDQFPLK